MMETRVGIEGRQLTWCVLRTSSRSTLRLAKSLTEDGFEAWTPEQVVQAKIPERQRKRNGPKTKPRAEAMLPSYVFARVDRFGELVALSRRTVEPRMGAKGHSAFSIPQLAGRYMLMTEPQLQALRTLEAKNRIRAQREAQRRAAQSFPKGASVIVLPDGGIVSGLRGTVRKSTLTMTTFLTTDFRRITVQTSLLSLDEICGQGVPN